MSQRQRFFPLLYCFMPVMQHSAGIANDKQMVQWTFAVSASPWAEPPGPAERKLRLAYMPAVCFARRSSSSRIVIRLFSRSYSRTSKSNSLEVLHPPTLEADSRALFKATLIILTQKGKARYPAFQMHRKHITALSPTQTYTQKRTSTPLIHIRCILTRFPSWHRYQQRLLGGRPFGLSRPDQQSGSSGWRICQRWCFARRSSSPPKTPNSLGSSESRVLKVNQNSF